MKSKVLSILTAAFFLGTGVVAVKNHDAHNKDSEKTFSITKLSPDSTYAGGFGGTLYIVGDKFTGKCSAKWNGIERETKFVSANLLEVSILPEDISQANIAKIIVCEQHGTSTQPATFTIKNLNGALGPQGLKGDQGNAGQIGLTGPQGLKGDAGPKGIQGEKGDTGADGSMGPVGPQGIAGPIGATGPAGPRGIAGPIGPQGLKGETGPQGIQGIPGQTICLDQNVALRANESITDYAKRLSLDVNKTIDLGNGLSILLVLVPAGSFNMGCNNSPYANEAPQHAITITKPYYIGATPITVEQFAAFVKATNYETETEKDGVGWGVQNGLWGAYNGLSWKYPGFNQTVSEPVVLTSWTDTQVFCQWLVGKCGKAVRLPSEAEWEFAARGPNSNSYPWGNVWDGRLCNHADMSLVESGQWDYWWNDSDNDGFAFTSPVGIYNNASWCGAVDMSGNVWQTCQDWYGDTYFRSCSAQDPTGPTTGTNHVGKGGSWYDDVDSTECSRRDGSISPPLCGCSASNTGFRIVIPATRCCCEK